MMEKILKWSFLCLHFIQFYSVSQCVFLFKYTLRKFLFFSYCTQLLITIPASLPNNYGNGNACASMDNDIKQHCIKIHYALHTVNQSKWDILWACICFEAVKCCCYYWKKEEAMDWSLFRRKQIREKRVICSLVRACNLNSSIVDT